MRWLRRTSSSDLWLRCRDSQRIAHSLHRTEESVSSCDIIDCSAKWSVLRASRCALALGRLVGTGVAERQGMAFLVAPSSLAAHITHHGMEAETALPLCGGVAATLALPMASESTMDAGADSRRRRNQSAGGEFSWSSPPAWFWRYATNSPATRVQSACVGLRCGRPASSRPWQERRVIHPIATERLACMCSCGACANAGDA